MMTLVAALLPKINTALTTDDASDKSEDIPPLPLDNYTLKYDFNCKWLFSYSRS